MKKLIIFLLILLYSCADNYVDFHQEKNNFEKENNIIENQISEFSFDNLKNLEGISLTQTPNLDYLDELALKITEAKKRVYLEVYILTETRIQKALIEAYNNGVEVKVLLEKNVYMAPSLNTKSYNKLKKAGIDVRFSNEQNYSLNHSKMMIVDDEVVLSTGNYSYSSFKYNKEFFLNINNSELLNIFLDIFGNDFEGIIKNIYDENLVLSPFYSREKLEYMIKNANNSIKMYIHNISDQNILNLLIEAKNRGVDIELILPSLDKVSSNEDEIKLLDENNIDYVLTKGSIQNHAKSILVDEKYLYIGSVNFSEYSMDKNREIGIILINQDLIKKYITFFESDFN